MLRLGVQVKQDSFEELFDRAPLHDFLQEKGITRPTPVQKAVPPLFRTHNLSVLAPTGSGKTLSYLLPLFDWLKSYEQEGSPRSDKGAPQAVILSPTRELSQQIVDAARELAHHLKLRVRGLASGQETKKDRELFQSAFEILVASPSRLAKAIEQKRVRFGHLKVLIFDEADQLLDPSFAKELKLIMAAIDEQPEVKVHLFSATLAEGMVKRRDELMERAFKSLVVDQPHHLSVKLETFNIYLSLKEKMPMLETFLKREAKGPGIIFVNNKKVVDQICAHFKEINTATPLVALHGEISQKERREAHRQFKAQKAHLVCTDIAARGIDHPELKWVLNFDLPFDPVYYIHRSGRVGRQDKTGLVYNFVTSADLPLIEKINQAIEKQTALELKPLKSGPLKARRPAAAKKTAPAQKGRKAVRELATDGRKVVKKKRTPRYKKGT